MNVARVLTLLFWLVLVPGALAEGSRSSIIPEGDIALSNLRIGDSRETVDTHLGRPVAESVPEYAVFCEAEVSIRYETAEASFCDGHLVNLSTGEPRHATPRGLRVGMSLAEAHKMYGTPEKLNAENLFAYRNQNGDLSLIIRVEGDLVVELELWCDYT